MGKPIRVAVMVVAVSACSAEHSTFEEDLTRPDASSLPRADAGAEPIPVDAPGPVHDVAPTPDAPCMQQVTQLLVNPAFDTLPQGQGWQQKVAVAGYPPITTEDGVPEHTAPFKAWLGGIEATTGTINDAVFQDLKIPMHTTQLVLSGMLDVRTAETAEAAYDTAKIVVTEVDGTLLETVLTLSNLTTNEGWTSFAHAFTRDLSGRTVRIRLAASNDTIDPTSFFFDSLTLNAIHGCAAP